MHVTATVANKDGHVVAECREYEAKGEGRTQAEALRALRAVLRERVLRVEAVAPPPDDAEPEIEIVLAPPRDEQAEHDPEGPGEAR
jgi:hypothetical protein